MTAPEVPGCAWVSEPMEWMDGPPTTIHAIAGEGRRPRVIVYVHGAHDDGGPWVRAIDDATPALVDCACAILRRRAGAWRLQAGETRHAALDRWWRWIVEPAIAAQRW